MTEKSVTLFPHTHITSGDLKKVLAHFGPITIYQPWFMENLLSDLDKTDVSLVQIKRPPGDKKPDGSFKKLLSEYLLWIRNNQDKGYTAFLSASFQDTLSEDTSWEIRKMVNQINRESTALSQENITKWHLILHLAKQLEENRSEATAALKRLKNQESPLAGAIEDATSSKPPLQDLPYEETYFLSGKHHIRPVLESWFGLFGGYLTDHETLLTLNGQVWDYVAEIFDDLDTLSPGDQRQSKPQDPEPGQTPMVSKILPKLPNGKKEPGRSIGSHLSGKTIIFLKG